MVQAAQGARACAADLAGLVVEKAKALQVEVFLLRCSRAQCGCAHIVPVVPALPVAVAMACEWERVEMGSHQDQEPDCSEVLEEQVEHIVAVMRATPVDAAEGCIHSALGAGRFVLSVGDTNFRRNLGCYSAVLAVAADWNIPREQQAPTEADNLGLVRDDKRASFCVYSPRLAGYSADLHDVVRLQAHERRNVAWLACAYVQAWFLLDCRVPDGRGLRVRAGIGHRVGQ